MNRDITYLNHTTESLHELVRCFFQSHFNDKGEFTGVSSDTQDKLYDIYHGVVDILDQYEDGYDLDSKI